MAATTLGTSGYLGELPLATQGVRAIWVMDALFGYMDNHSSKHAERLSDVLGVDGSSTRAAITGAIPALFA